MSIQDYAGISVERGSLTNLDTSEEKTFLLNPTELRETYGARYAMKAPLGLSYQRPQYLGGENGRIPLTLYFDQQIVSEATPASADPIDGRVALREENANDVEDWRNFLLSLIPPRRARKIASASPPPVLFVWPGIFEMRVRIERVSFRHTLFQLGRPRQRAYVADVEMFEAPLEPIYSSDVRTLGTRRPWASRLG